MRLFLMVLTGRIVDILVNAWVLIVAGEGNVGEGGLLGYAA